MFFVSEECGEGDGRESSVRSSGSLKHSITQFLAYNSAFSQRVRARWKWNDGNFLGGINEKDRTDGFGEMR